MATTRVIAIQGALRPAQSFVWERSAGVPEDLTGATLTGVIVNVNTRDARAITGTIAATDADAGEFAWTYSSADVAENGTFEVQFNAAFLAAPTPARTRLTEWVVLPAAF